VHVLYLIDSLSTGGAERSLAELAPGYAARGIHLDVAYFHERPGVQEDLRRAGAELFPLGGSGRVDFARRALRLVRERRPDLVHTTLFEADIAGRVASWRARVPVVSSLVNLAYGPEQLTDPDLRRWRVEAARRLDAFTARRVTRFHAITRVVAEVMSQRLRLRRGRVDVIPRGRDPEIIGRRTRGRREDARRRLGVDGGAPLVFAAARQEFQKGLDVLVEAFPAVRAAVPEARLVIAGREGGLTEQLGAAVARLGLGDAVAFLGARTDVLDLMCAADVFAFPSRWEGLGVAVLEAMALEAPIVASDIPAIREVLGAAEERALLVPPDAPGALAAAISRTLTDAAAGGARALAARERFLERFTLDRVADATLVFYERALAEGRSARAATTTEDG
jgi:glycosyltransferase involved in cell wall biosynthesis